MVRIIYGSDGWWKMYCKRRLWAELDTLHPLRFLRRLRAFLRYRVRTRYY
jgi:hypothetical protein